MIIWSRWGFLSFLAFGLGVAAGLPLATGLGFSGGPIVGAMIFAFAGAFNALLAFLVYPRLDKPRPITYTQPLPQPIRHENGQVQTHGVFPALDQQGQPLWSAPTSTLFFIPAKFFWVICLVVAVVLGVVAMFSR